MSEDGRTRLAAVLGWPIGHSLSPALHGAWFARHAVRGAYVPLPVAAEDLPLAFRALPRLGFLGWNVTLPHKERAAELVDELDVSAARTGVVNTVLVSADHRTRGYSTDGFGFLANLCAQAPDWRAGQGPALLLGSGGAARAVAVALLEAGCAELRLVNRDRARAERLAADLARLFPGACLSVAGWEHRAASLDGVALCVNCTSLGMVGQPPLELALDALPLTAVVADLLYRPLRTTLLVAAARRGHPVVDGLGMLVWQAVPGFSHWGGVTPVVDGAIRAVLLRALGEPAEAGVPPLER
jgi:shikimate dehydrogenase